MIIKNAEFIISNTDINKCPAPIIPEYAFVGRSNVGKSSLINRLTNKKKLAKISSTPGKTQYINHFKINDEWYLVDLPGYGYAKVPKTYREKWRKMLNSYLLHRKNLANVFVLIDSRLSPQKKDVEFINRLGTKSIPFTIIFTKIDKLTKQELNENIILYKKELLNYWEELPTIIMSSAKNGEGKDIILNFIDETNKTLD